jgi:pilus assembly protein CpaD
MVDNDYRLKHPIAVEPVTAQLRLDADADGTVPTADRARLRDFAGRFVAKGRGQVEVSVGAREETDTAARAYAEDIARVLQAEGLKASELRLQLVIADPMRPAGHAFLAFSTVSVTLPDCGDWREGETNAPHPNFGCALQRNLGAMVADPRDLERARDSGGAHSTREDAVIDKYNHGDATWSPPLPLSSTTKTGAGGSQGGQ